MGDLPWLEARRGGHRVWSLPHGAAEARGDGFSPRPSTTPSDREDDFEALKQAALRGVKPSRRGRTVVLPGEEVGRAAGGRGRLCRGLGWQRPRQPVVTSAGTSCVLAAS